MCLLALSQWTTREAVAATPYAAQKLNEAQAVLDAGNYEGAFARHMELLREHPDDVSVNVAAARSAKLAGRYNHALMLYERLTATLPENAVMRLEYAHLLLALGRAEQARLELAEAKRLDPNVGDGDDDVGKTIAAMERRVRTVEYNLRLAGGVIYDSNMTTGPSLRGVEVGGLPITLDRKSAERESMGGYMHFAGDVAWRATADTPWRLVADVAGYQRWYERTTPRRDLTFGRAAAGLRYLSGPALAEMRVKIDTLLENEEKSVNVYGAEGTFAYAVKHDLHFMVRGALEHREDIATRGRSGAYAWGGPYLRYFFGEANHSVMVGVKTYASDADQRRFGYTGAEPGVSLFLNLPARTELVLSGSWHNEDYKGGATIFDGQDRRDRQWRGSAFVIKKITDNLRVETGYQYTHNTSNSDLYNYTQHLVTMGLALTF